MAVGDLQFNPSTGLASFNAATSKAQLTEIGVDTCTGCLNRVINNVEVTFSDMTICPEDCFFDDGLFTVYELLINPNQAWTLLHIANCKWRLDLVGMVEKRTYLSSCSDPPDTTELVDGYIEIQRGISAVPSLATLRFRWEDVPGRGAFLFFKQYTITSECVIATGIVNDKDTCNVFPDDLNLYIAGTAAVVEL